MSEQEATLDQGLADLKTSISAAADRVIAKLQAKDIDLSDEIADIQSMKDAVNLIAPDEPAPEPAPEG